MARNRARSSARKPKSPGETTKNPSVDGNVSTSRGRKRTKKESTTVSPSEAAARSDTSDLPSASVSSPRNAAHEGKKSDSTSTSNNNNTLNNNSSNSRKKRRSKSPSRRSSMDDEEEQEAESSGPAQKQTVHDSAKTSSATNKSRTPTSDGETTFWSATDVSLGQRMEEDDDDDDDELNVKRQLFAEKKTLLSPPPSHTGKVRVTPDKKKKKKKAPSQLDVSVHRIRHLNLVPRSILRMVATPPSTISTAFSSTYLALSREGGSVQVLAVDQKYRSVHFIAGLRNRNVDALTWICGARAPSQEEGGDDTYSCIQHEESEQVHSKRRLFGGSRDGTLFELDLTCHLQTGVMGSGGGAVFAMTSLCPCCTGGRNSDGGCAGYLATANEDGCVRIFRPASRESKAAECLDLIATLPPAGAPVLSIAWRSPTTDDVLNGSTLYAGCADASIRRYDCVPRTGKRGARDSSSSCKWQSTLRMTVESLNGRRGHWASSSSTRVWALLALSDGTVVSGDSLGHVQIWDGASGTLLQSFEQSEVKADVLDLAVSFDESRIFAAGIDPRVTCLQRYLPSSDDAVASWVLSHAQIPHTHDVKALTIGMLRDASGSAGSSSSSGEEILFSAGVDTKLCTYKVLDFQGPRPRRINPSFVPTPLCLSKKERVLALLTAESVEIHQLEPAPSELPVSSLRVDHEKTLLGSVTTSGPYNLVCCDISDDGRFLALSDGGGLMIFAMDYPKDRLSEAPDRRIVTATKIALSTKLARLTCTVVKFGPTGSPRRLFCASTEGPVVVLKVVEEPPEDETQKDTSTEGAVAQVTMEHEFVEHLQGARVATCPLSSMTISPDYRWLVVGRNTLGSHAIHVFRLTTADDANASMVHWWNLPALEAPHTCLEFLGDSKNDMDATLAVGCCNNGFYMFDLERKRLGEWSLDAGFPLTPLLPVELKERSDFPQRMVYNPATPHQFLLGGLGFFCAIHLDRAVPQRAPIFPPNHVEARRYHKKGVQTQDKEEDEEEEEEEEEGEDGLEMDVEQGRKRQRSPLSENAAHKNFTLCLCYNGMMFMDFVQENEMVVVERPWLSTLQSLPDALEKRVYGT